MLFQNFSISENIIICAEAFGYYDIFVLLKCRVIGLQTQSKSVCEMPCSMYYKLEKSYHDGSNRNQNEKIN
jgi:hypothetical protein